MSFRAELVAFGEDASAAPFLGHQFTQLILREPDGRTDASNPVNVAAYSRDKIIESTDGRDVATVLRKLSQVVLAVDYLDTATKAKLERLYHDGRELYFCPNVGPSTRWSFPLQRGLADFAGRKTIATNRAQKIFLWDEDEKVFRSWAANTPAIAFGGHWTRCLRTVRGVANAATYPHPTSTGHGWSFLAGSGTLTYTESILSPVLEKRTVANQRGVVACYANAGTIAVLIIDSTATLSTSNSVIANVCVAWQGTAIFVLLPTAGGTIVDSKQVEGDGTFQFIKLGGTNTDAVNQYRVQVYLVDCGSKKQAAIFGPTMIASYVMATSPDRDDWNEGAVAFDLVEHADTVAHLITDFTFSCFFRWAPVRAGLVVIGNNVLSVQKRVGDEIQVISAGALSPMSWTNVQAQLGAGGKWGVGDWIHLVVRGSGAGGLALFINGEPHPSNGTEPWEPSDTDYRIKLGSAYGDFLPDSGISHVRLDAVAWSDQEIVDHYHTYFERGRGVVEPLFGKVLTIDELSLSPRVGSGLMQWVGRVVLSELGPREEFAPLQRQEGDV